MVEVAWKNYGVGCKDKRSQRRKRGDETGLYIRGEPGPRNVAIFVREGETTTYQALLNSKYFGRAVEKGGVYY